MRVRRGSGNSLSGRSRGKQRGRRARQSKDAKGERTVKTAAPALFAFIELLDLSAWRSACAAPGAEDKMLKGINNILKAKLYLNCDYIHFK